MNARGYEQIESNHYFKYDLAAPVTNATLVRVVLVLMAMNAAWIAEVIGVDREFLQGKFTNREVLYMIWEYRMDLNDTMVTMRY